eukprot:12897551-Prorocentrum_lima.AAC.1
MLIMLSSDGLWPSLPSNGEQHRRLATLLLPWPPGADMGAEPRPGVGSPLPAHDNPQPPASPVSPTAL